MDLPVSCESRRSFIGRMLASGILARDVFARDAKSDAPSLRQMAGGRPLIGAAVPTGFAKRMTPDELRLVTTHFDSVTPENCMKWPALCPKDGEYRFEDADALVALAGANGQKIVGHTLIFNRDDGYPAWLLRDGGKEADAALVWKRIESHVGTVMSRYKGQIDSWDVLNEFVELGGPGYRETALTKVLGGDFPVRLFKLAAEIDPGAKLTYNDYSVEVPSRRKAILAFIRDLQDKGCRVDVVGNQGHVEIGDHPGRAIDETIREFSKIGVRSALTEIDVDVVPRKPFWNPKTRDEAMRQDPYADGCPAEVLERQAQVYREMFDAVIAHRKEVDRVTFWGVTDRISWLNTWPWRRVNHGLLFDRKAKPKPAFHAVARVLAGR